MFPVLIASCRPVKITTISTIFKCYKCANLQSVVVKRNVTTKQTFDVNTNVVKDVLLYQMDGTKHIRWLNFFAVGQFAFWNYLAETIFSTFRPIPIDSKEDDPWYVKFGMGSDAMRYSLTGLCLVLGNGLLATAYLYTTRAIKFIVLKKGGQSIVLATYTPLGGTRTITVPVSHVSANESRALAKVSIPIKIKGKRLFYLLDMAGKFGNQRLFDATVGLSRKFKTV